MENPSLRFSASRSENRSFRNAQAGRCHAENGMPHSEIHTTLLAREVLHGVGARGRSEIPIVAVNCSRLPLSSRRIREKRRKTKKSEEKQRKAKGKIPLTASTPTPLRTSQLTFSLLISDDFWVFLSFLSDRSVF